MMRVGDDVVITGSNNVDSILAFPMELEMGELAQITEIDEFLDVALVVNVEGVSEWLLLDSLTPLGVLFGGFAEGVYADE